MIAEFWKDFYSWSKSTVEFETFKTEALAQWRTGNKYSEGLVYKVNGQDAIDENYFVSSSEYYEKWMPWMNALDTQVNVISSSQTAWGSTYVGYIRLRELLDKTSRFDATKQQIIYSALRLPTSVEEVYTIESKDIVLPKLNKTGYNFLGWYDNPEFTGNEIVKIAKGSYGNKTLYAKFEYAGYSVDMELNGANVVYSSREDMVDDFLTDALNWAGKTGKPVCMVDDSGATVGFANKFSAIYGFFSHDTYGPKWAWLKDYILNETTNESSKSYLEGGNEAFWRYSIGAFLFKDYRSTYPVSENFTVEEKANGFWDELLAIYESKQYTNTESLPKVYKVGYKFIGWYDNPEFTGNAVSAINDNIKLYARFEKEYTITYDFDGGVLNYSSREDMVDDFLTDALNWAGKTGKPVCMVDDSGATVGFANKFSAIYGFFSHDTYGPKWAWLKDYILNETTNESSKSYLEGGNEAFWRYSIGAFLFKDYRSTYPVSENFTVEEKANGFWDEYVAHTSSEMVIGNYKLPTAVYKENYTFAGWYDNPEFTGNVVTSVNDTTTLYAKWTDSREYTVKFDYNGGAPEVSKLDSFAEQLVALFNSTGASDAKETTREDFKALSHPNIKYVWNKAENLEAYRWFFEFAIEELTLAADTNKPSDLTYFNSTIKMLERMIDGDTTAIGDSYADARTIFRFWIEGLINNKYVQTGTSYYQNLMIDYSSKENMSRFHTASSETVLTPNDTLPTPIKKDYKFVGWYNGEQLVTTVTSNCTLVAKWELDAYTVNFDYNGGTPAVSKLDTFANELVELFKSTGASDAKVTTRENFKELSHPNIKYVWNKAENLEAYRWFFEFAIEEITAAATANDYTNNSYFTNTIELLEKMAAGDTTAVGGSYADGRTAFRYWIEGLINSKLPAADDIYEKMMVDYSNESNMSRFHNLISTTLLTQSDELPIPTRKGYKFEGWYIGEDKVTSVASDCTLTAKWALDEYTITFKADGVEVETITYSTSNPLTDIPTVPAKEGYTGKWEEYELYTGNITVNAIYELIRYNVEFDLDGGVFVGKDLDTFAEQLVALFNSTGASDAKETTREDFKALSHPNIKYVWNKAENLEAYRWFFEFAIEELTLAADTNKPSDLTYFNSTIKMLERMIDGDTTAIGDSYADARTIFRFWIEGLINNKYVQTGTSYYQNLMVDYSVEENLKRFDDFQLKTQMSPIDQLPLATKDGYEFLGWYDGETKVEKVSGDATLVAKWSPIQYEVTFMANGEEALESEKVNYGSLFTVPSSTGLTIPAGKYFDGWVDGEGEGAKAYQAGDQITLTSDIILYAVFKDIPTVTIEEALALEDGSYIKVSGTVSKINTVWNDSYGNISVTITDGENELYIFRLATKVVLGDKITVTGQMGTYDEQRQVAQGATAEITGHDESYDYSEMTIAEALAAADGTGVIVSGTVCAINTAWSDSYGNISVTITDGQNQLYLYRLSTNVALGDQIIVKGSMGTFNEARQVAQGATAEITGHDNSYDYKEMSIAEALASDDNALVQITGTVCVINTAWSESYGNITVTITDGTNEMYLYRLATNVALGDIIVVKGAMATYSGNRQVTGGTAEIIGKTSNITITYYYNNGDDSTIGSASALANVNTTLKSQEELTAPNGKVFVGWSKDKNATEPEYTSADTVYFSSNTDLYAIWADEGSQPLVESIDIAANQGTLAGDSLSISWQTDSFNIVGFKANSSTAIRTSDSNHFRIYQGSEFNIVGKENQQIIQIIFTITESKYVTPCLNSLSSIGTATNAGNVITFIPNGGSTQELLITATAQFRISNIEITFKEAEEGAHVHNHSITNTVPATCTEAGEYTYTCECGDSYTEEIPMIDHEYVEGVCGACGAEDPNYIAPDEISGSTESFTFSSFTAGTQYAEGEEHKLSEYVTIYTTQCHFTSELRIYSSSTHDGYVVSAKLPAAIASMSFNAGNKVDTLNVYGSTDGIEWNLVEGVSITATSYNDYEVNFGDTNYTYFKLDVAGANQVRVKTLSITYK